jgi:hypothetical protein
MKYTKPEVLFAGSGLATICNGIVKGFASLDKGTDPGAMNATSTAYEADE